MGLVALRDLSQSLINTTEKEIEDPGTTYVRIEVQLEGDDRKAGCGEIFGSGETFIVMVYGIVKNAWVCVLD